MVYSQDKSEVSIPNIPIPLHTTTGVNNSTNYTHMITSTLQWRQIPVLNLRRMVSVIYFIFQLGKLVGFKEL